MKKNGWIVIIATLIALLMPAAGIQIALHGKTVPLDKGRQEMILDGTQSGAAGNGVQTDVSKNGAQTDASESEAQTDTVPEEPTPAPVTEEQKAYYLSLEAACSDTLSDGTQMRLLATDRACGSSYYTLIGVKDGECTFVNTDPFNGSGGEALFITFPDQETEGRGQTGYAGLAYSGGSLEAFISQRTEADIFSHWRSASRRFPFLMIPPTVPSLCRRRFMKRTEQFIL